MYQRAFGHGSSLILVMHSCWRAFGHELTTRAGVLLAIVFFVSWSIVFFACLFASRASLVGSDQYWHRSVIDPLFELRS